MAQTYLTKTSPTAGNRTKGTISLWFKRSKLGSNQWIYSDYYSSDNYAGIRLNSGDNIGIWSINGGTGVLNINTNRKFRDNNAWYNLVVAWDTSNGTASDRIKIYVNGERETSFSGSPTYPSQDGNLMFSIGGSYPIVIGRDGTNNSDYFDGSMSHFHRVDNQALAPTVFGSTDSVTGEWQINTSPSITYTGSSDYNFFILKDGNSLTDQSGQSNDLTLGYGTLTKTEDNPSNNFATINTLLGSDQIGSTVEFSSGNTLASDPNGQASGINPSFISTLGMPSKGKWYCEVQPDSFSTGSGHSIGIFRSKGDIRPSSLYSDKIRYIFADTAYYIVKYGSNDQTSLTSVTAGQTVGMALDLDNGTLQYYVNGAARHNAVTGINSANDGYDYFFLMDLESSSSGRYGICKFNFGNGAFGSNQLTGTTYQDSNGQGVFKHQPPTNFLALCTKNLNV